jgi:hypothetical protein
VAVAFRGRALTPFEGSCWPRCEPPPGPFHFDIAYTRNGVTARGRSSRSDGLTKTRRLPETKGGGVCVSTVSMASPRSSQGCPPYRDARTPVTNTISNISISARMRTSVVIPGDLANPTVPTSPFSVNLVSELLSDGARRLEDAGTLQDDCDGAFAENGRLDAAKIVTA